MKTGPTAGRGNSLLNLISIRKELDLAKSLLNLTVFAMAEIEVLEEEDLVFSRVEATCAFLLFSLFSWALLFGRAAYDGVEERNIGREEYCVNSAWIALEL